MDRLILQIEKLTPSWENMAEVPIFVRDMKGRYVYVNTAFAEFLGRSISSILYKKPEDLWIKNKRQIDIFFRDDRLIFDGVTRMTDSVVVIEDAANRDRFMRIFKTPVFNSHETEILGIIGVAFDITSDREKIFTMLNILFRRLSKSEKQYFFFRTEGRTRAEIAKDMGTTVETIDSFRYRIMKKLFIKEEEMFFLETVYKLFIDYSCTS